MTPAFHLVASVSQIARQTTALDEGRALGFGTLLTPAFPGRKQASTHGPPALAVVVPS